tara:strand:- start:1358 stop:1984 length:627 start_codon:yes stop_codon:yes gene_type:complete
MTSIILHHNDLPADVDFGASVAIDTETMGLNPARDRLCLVQMMSAEGDCHLVKFDGKNYDAPNLKRILANEDILKLFHFARFDVAVLQAYLGVLTEPIYCTKIASRLVRTFTPYHGLKNLCRDLLGEDISKHQQSSDWGADELTEDQLEYAASDVLYLHGLKSKLDEMLEREGRLDLAHSCFDFLPTRAMLDLRGWAEEDIFSHSINR